METQTLPATSTTDTVQNMQVAAYTIPTATPESDGTLEWDSTTLILVEVEGGGKRGLGYTYSSEAAAHLINNKLKPLIVGKDFMTIEAINQRMVRALRNDGANGLCMMAVSAVDIALWDLKAKVLDLPLCTLLGQKRDTIEIYGSGGFTSYSKDELMKQLGQWANEGMKQVKMKVGRQPDQDVERVKAARAAIGQETELFVDANGAYSTRNSVVKAFAFAEQDVSWLEEPVPSAYLDELRFIRNHVPPEVRIAAGEYGHSAHYFKTMLDANAVDVLQADASRCGGITGFLQAGTLCDAFRVPFSSHCVPSVHLHAALAVPSFYTAEYFFDHVRIEQLLFDGAPKAENGLLQPDHSRPGLGLEFKHQDAKKYQVL